MVVNVKLEYYGRFKKMAGKETEMIALPQNMKAREFDSKKQKKRLEALQTLHFFVKFSIFILRLFTSNAII